MGCCLWTLVLFWLAPPGTAGAETVLIPLYRTASVSFEKRVDSLIRQLTLEEKIGLLMMDSHALPRLGIKGYHWWNECIHGVARAGRATQFPVPIALAASWNPDMVYRVASAVGDEMRAKHTYGADSPLYGGLTCWGPNLNLARDPRWGRIDETYGEDPFLTGQFAKVFIAGLQGDHPRYLKVAATPKHFAAYSSEANRGGNDVHVSGQALRDFYLPAFRDAVVTAGAASLMVSYNGINGVPNAINAPLVSQLLRSEWRFKGPVVADVQALSQVRSHHRVAASYPEIAARFLKSGGSLFAEGAEWRSYLRTAVNRGLISEADLHRPLAEVLGVRFRLGEFDPPDLVPYTRIPSAIVGSDRHRGLALHAAREGVVLLQNRPLGAEASPLLPLNRVKIRSIVVLGPYADRVQLGSYSGDPANRPVTPLAGIRERAGAAAQVRHLAWRADQAGTLREDEQRIIAQADVVIAVVGLDEHLEREGLDRHDLGLPQGQSRLLKQAYGLNQRMVVVLENGGPVSDAWIAGSIPAVVELWYPGEQGGAALADVLLGDYNPAGRLPLTVYMREDQLPAMDDYEVSHGRTYRYLKDRPLYPFGHGKSYTRFTYRDLVVVPTKERLEVALTVTNSGNRDGDEVVQLYGFRPEPQNGQAQRQLIGFQRMHLKKGETRQLTITVPLRRLAAWDGKAYSLLKGRRKYEIQAGASSEDIRLRTQIEHSVESLQQVWN